MHSLPPFFVSSAAKDTNGPSHFNSFGFEMLFDGSYC